MISNTEALSAPRKLLPARLLDLAAANSLLVVLLAVIPTALIAMAPQLLVADSWMTLVAGRDIAQHGLPSHESLTVLAAGHRWTDQQWLAQILFYGAESLGGMKLAALLDVSLVSLAFAVGVVAARRNGSTARSTLIVAIFALLVAPWSWQLRAQAFALPLFVLVLTLAAADVRRPRARTFLALPLLALWANIHGSVLVGAGIVSLAGLAGLVSRATGKPGAPRYLRSMVLAVAPWPCLLVSPYAIHLPGYYRLMLVDSPVSKVIAEWQAPKPHGWYLVFFGFAVASALLALWHRRRVGWYGVAVLAITLAGSLRSGRGIVWFTLAALVLIPAALDGATNGQETPLRRRLGIALSGTFAVLMVVTTVAMLARPGSWFETGWPEVVPQRIARVAEAVPGRKVVYPSDMHADWLLWKAPSLEGRVAYDVRFELLNGSQLQDLVRFKKVRPGWLAAADGYPIVVFDRSEDRDRISVLRRRPGTTVLFENKSLVVLERPVAGS